MYYFKPKICGKLEFVLISNKNRRDIKNPPNPDIQLSDAQMTQ